MSGAQAAVTKRCTKCGEVKSLEEFHRDRRGKDGRRARCRSCVGEYARANRERGTEAMRQWRAKNPERNRRNSQRWHEQNREEVNARRRKHRAENPHGDWESDYRKRSRAADCIPVVRSFTREELIEFWGNGARCVYCDGPFEEIDHLQPIALGGVHAVETVVPSCSGCNQEGGKHARNFLRQMTEEERYLEVVVGAARARLAPIA